MASIKGDHIKHKLCCYCKQHKSEALFNKNTNAIDGLQTYCRACQKAHKLRYLYGLEADDLAALIAKQGSRCAICKEPLSKFVVDHCHTTGAVRGILCNACNVGIGQFCDDTHRLQRAIGYLRMKR